MTDTTIDIREGEDLPREALAEFLAARIDGLEGLPEVRQFPQGNSNLTYLLRYPGRDLVLRRPPLGTLAKSAHSMEREYRVMNSLRPAYPAVPETLLYVAGGAPLDSEFYVMAKVPGTVPGKRLPAAWKFGPTENRRLSEQFWDKLVELHAVDYEAVGLGDFGRPEGYVGRQIGGWCKRYLAALTPDVDPFEPVRNWLTDKQPPDTPRAAVLHGDYRLDNVILAPDDPLQIAAVLDWEISALGDPLMDLGNSLAYWIEAADAAPFKAFAMQPSAAPGMPTRDEILERYLKATGLDVKSFDFYLVYGYFRQLVILQQIYYRYYHGQTKNQHFARFRDVVMLLGQHCLDLIERSKL